MFVSKITRRSKTGFYKYLVYSSFLEAKLSVVNCYLDNSLQNYCRKIFLKHIPFTRYSVSNVNEKCRFLNFPFFCKFLKNGRLFEKIIVTEIALKLFSNWSRKMAFHRLLCIILITLCTLVHITLEIEYKGLFDAGPIFIFADHRASEKCN